MTSEQVRHMDLVLDGNRLVEVLLGGKPLPAMSDLIGRRTIRFRFSDGTVFIRVIDGEQLLKRDKEQ